ncbi:Hypothetical predicted protein [Lynx pardinus]|uniref:Uncharacterized protein n=1 Tax=Lynx pardinus TaxID=191816 RepID=A0A485N9U9_LYNPA|nr:Hypothetical predicted protein [Lynx pardinus]
MMLPVPRNCGWVPVRPRKRSRDGVAAAFQGLWKITTPIWHQASPLTTLSSTSECGHSLGSAGPRNRFSPCGLRTFQTPLCSWGFAVPTRYRATELRTLCSPCLQS